MNCIIHSEQNDGAIDSAMMYFVYYYYIVNRKVNDQVQALFIGILIIYNKQ